jgi:hypothetical protein
LLLIRILPQHAVEHLLQHLLRPFPLYPLLPDERHQVLSIALISLPNAVAAHEDEVVVLAQLDHLDVRMASDGLPLVGQRGVLLIVQVS